MSGIDWQGFFQWLAGVIIAPACVAFYDWTKRVRKDNEEIRGEVKKLSEDVKRDIDALHKKQRLQATYLKLIIKELRRPKAP